MYRSILVPLDASAFAEHALPLALEVARRAGAVLHPVHVYRPEEPWREFATITPYRFEREVAYEPAYERGARGHARDYLRQVAELAGARGVEAAPELLDGDVAAAVERHAGRIGADLIVMATHGRGPLSRTWIGSVADRLVRELPVPVLLVRPREDTPPESDRPPPLEHVLIPLDGSPLAESVLGPAAELGRLWRARCTLLTVVAAGGFPGGLTPAPSPEGRELTAAGQAEAARAYLEQTAGRIERDWSRVDFRVVEEMYTASAIGWAAERLGARLVAISTHGRGGLQRFVLGSVADKVVRAAVTPVLVHRP